MVQNFGFAMIDLAFFFNVSSLLKKFRLSYGTEPGIKIKKKNKKNTRKFQAI